MQRFLTSVGGPVFAKELLEAARRRRYFANRVFYALALLVVLAVVWQDAQYLYRGHLSTADMARFAHAMFIAVNVVQYLAVWFFVPVFVCGLVASEREANTLELLLTSHLTDREIVLGKLFSRWAIVLQILLSTLPVVCLIGMFGGIDASSVGRTLLTTLLAMLVAGAVSIYFSCVSRSPVGALIRTYWWLAVWLLFLPFLAVFILEVIYRAGPASPLANLLFGQMFINPVGSFLLALDPVQGDRELTSRIGWWYYWPMYLGPALIAGLIVWRAVARLRVDPSGLLISRLASWLLQKHFRGLGGWRERRLARRAIRAERGRLGPVRNPIWLRSRLARVYDREGYIGRIQWMGWIAAVAILSLMAIFNPRDLDDQATVILSLMPTWIGLGLLLTVISASSIVSDRRRGFFELVLVTTLSAREIVDGTLLAVWHHLRRTWWLAVSLTMFFVLIGAVKPHCALVSLVSGSLFAIVVAETGLATSLAAKTLPQSLVPTFALTILMTLGTGLLVMTFREASGPIAWILAILLPWPAWIWMRRTMSAPAIGAFFIVVHFVLVTFATAFSFDGRNFCLPIGLSNPASLVIGAVANRQNYIGDLFVNARRYNGVERHFDAGPHIAAYWLALVINIIWARWWILSRFDRLTGRITHVTGPQRQIPALEVPAAEQVVEAAV